MYPAPWLVGVAVSLLFLPSSCPAKKNDVILVTMVHSRASRTCQKAGGGGGGGGFAKTTGTQEEWGDSPHTIESGGHFWMAGRRGSRFNVPFVSQTNSVMRRAAEYTLKKKKKNPHIDRVIWFFNVEKYGKLLVGNGGLSLEARCFV